MPSRFDLRALFALIVSLSCSWSALADEFVISVGAACRLERDVSIDVKTGQGRVKVPLSKGTRLSVVAVTQNAARVASGEFEGQIDNATLEDACTYAAEVCKLKAPVKVSERVGGEGKAWRIKTGGKLEVLARDTLWSTVRIGPVSGFAETAALIEQCPELAAEKNTEAERDDEIDDGVEDDEDPSLDGEEEEEDQERTPLVLRKPPKGTRVMLVPALLDGRTDVARAVRYEEDFTVAMMKARSDAVGPSGNRPNAASRAITPKQVLVELVPAARELGVTHLVLIELTFDKTAPASKNRAIVFDDEPDAVQDRADLLFVTVFDIAQKKVTKRVKVSPTNNEADDWAGRALTSIAPHLPTTKAPQ